MLHAVLQQLGEMIPTAELVMAPGTRHSGYPYLNRARLGFYQKAWLWLAGIQLGDLAVFSPKKLREMYGIVLDKEVDLVLDAAGFAYSDQWGPGYTVELARASRRWKKNGTKVILLPQAFGPYESAKSIGAVRAFVENVDLVYARDKTSYSYLTDITGCIDKIKIRPDYTNLVQGIVPDYFDSDLLQVCLIPNYRMIDMTDSSVSNNYIGLMQRIARMLLDAGSKPFLLIHEGEQDLSLARQIAESVGNISIVQESDPIRVKGIIGACKGVIGSRFHGLVSALSQGVPSLATSWSHKYEMLFADYDVDSGVIDLGLSESHLATRLEIITDPAQRLEFSTRLLAKSADLKQQSREMWAEVFAAALPQDKVGQGQRQY